MVGVTGPVLRTGKSGFPGRWRPPGRFFLTAGRPGPPYVAARLRYLRWQPSGRHPDLPQEAAVNEHPPWCDLPRCRVTTSGDHVGGKVTVDGPDGRPLAALWVEGTDGTRTAQVSLSQGHGWTAAELRLLAAMAGALAERLPTAG